MSAKITLKIEDGGVEVKVKVGKQVIKIKAQEENEVIDLTKDDDSVIELTGDDDSIIDLTEEEIELLPEDDNSDCETEAASEFAIINISSDDSAIESMEVPGNNEVSSSNGKELGSALAQEFGLCLIDDPWID